MNRIHRFVSIMCLVWLSGCISHPQTPEEFRKAVPTAFSAKVETFEVDRPFSQVANTFQKMGPNCLSKTIKMTSQTKTSYQVIVTTYKPTVLVTPKKAELHVQFHHDQGVIGVGKEPEGGHYLLVADARPVSAAKTRIDLYHPTIGHAQLVQAVRAWASGTSFDCPSSFTGYG